MITKILKYIFPVTVMTAFVACGPEGPAITMGDDGSYDSMPDVHYLEDNPGFDTTHSGHDSSASADTNTQDQGITTDNAGIQDLSSPFDAKTGTDTTIHFDATPPSCDQEGITCIFLENDHILVNGDGAEVDGTVVTITAAGTYSISGTLDDGSVVVNTTDTDLTRLLLNGAQIASSTTSPLYIMDAGDVELFLVAETMNSLTDADSYVYETEGQDEPNAALFSKADLDITGLGLLNVNGNYNDAINVKDGLDILGGTIVAHGADDGIRGKDNVSILGGSVTVTAANNGIKADNSTDADRGYIEITGGTTFVTSGGDGLTAQTALTISNGNVATTTGGGSSVTVGDDASAKGIKGIGSVAITGGTIVVNSSDDGIHSDGPVTISGGSLDIDSALDGVHSETILKVQDGSIEIKSGGGSSKTISSSVSAKGLKGSLAVTITGSEMTIDSADDGIHSGGTVTLNGGQGVIVARTDGVHAESLLELANGNYDITCGGGSSRTVSSSSTAKGLKAGTSIIATGGTYDLDCADDGVHSDSSISITDGTFVIRTADDALHAEEKLTIDGGDISITKSYEGLESKEITINDGSMHIVSSDDGINVAGGDGSGGWVPGGSTSTTCFLYINGGYIWMNAGGDGLDSNGNIIMTGGTVLVNGPTDNGNGPIDLGDGGSYYFKISGGFIVAAGSSGMAVGNSTSSTQYGVLVNMTSSQSAGTIFHLRTSTGTERLTFKPEKRYQSVFFSSPELGTGSHEVYLGGSSSGTLDDNLYTGGTYTAGTRYTTFSVSSVATKVGSSGPGFP